MSPVRGRVLWLVGLLTVWGTVSAFAQLPVDPYFEFLNGRRLEKAGELGAALQAFERAAVAAPEAAGIRAEIARFQLDQNKPREAVASARAALALDDSNVGAHRVLGLLLGGSEERMQEAVGHLERVLETPAGGTDVALQSTLGRLYLFTGAVPKAIDLLGRLLEDQPYLLPARVTLAQAMAAAGRHDDAIAVLEPAARADPRLTASLALIYEGAGRLRDAADAYGRAAAASPNNRQFQLRHASALLVVPGASPLKQALNVLARLLVLDSKDAGALYLQSQAYRQTGDMFAAERSARAILATEPDSVAGAYALSLVLGQSRRFKDVVDYLEPFVASAAARGQSATDLLTYLSVAYQALGRHNEAIDALKRAKSAARDGTPALDARLVQAHVGAKRYAEAVSLAEAAQKRYPDELQFIYLQARALFQGGKSSQALSLLETVVGSHPDDLESYLTLAELYGESGRLDDGLRLLDRAAQQFPDNVAVPFRRGFILAEANRDADAEEAFRGVLNRQPNNGPALNYLGYMLADRGSRLDEAIELITRALSSDKDNPSYLDSLGWAFFKRGDLTEAEKHLTRAADALPLNSVVQDHYGDLLAKAGRYRDAVDAWIKALNGDSDEIDSSVVEQKIRDTRGKIR